MTRSKITIRILDSVKERLKKQGKTDGDSVNKCAERWLILGEKADKKLRGEK